jgi:hypothetical protein
MDKNELTSRFRSSLSAAESMFLLREYCLECLVIVVRKVIVNEGREEIINIYLLRKIEKLMDLILRLDLTDIIHLASSYIEI